MHVMYKQHPPPPFKPTDTQYLTTALKFSLNLHIIETKNADPNKANRLMRLTFGLLLQSLNIYV